MPSLESKKTLDDSIDIMAEDKIAAKLDARLLRSEWTTNPRPLPSSPSSPEVRLLEYHTDHMILVPWNVRTGWSTPALQSYGPIPIPPSASALHYATECFEGMKVYRGADGRLRLFRARENCERMRRSATRVALPSFEAAELEKLIIALCAHEAPKWLPKSEGESALYIRPTLIGTDTALATVRPRSALLFIILAVFPRATIPNPPRRVMKLLASSDDQIRAWPGGFGNCKVGANYGPGLPLHDEAKAQGCDQILWLFGPERLVTEAGASNFFVVLKLDEKTWELVTPPLVDDGGSGLILPGITRASILELARERLQNAVAGAVDRVEISERKLTMAGLSKAQIIEAFAVGTAVSVTSVNTIRHEGRDIRINCEPVNGVLCSQILKDWLVGIMNGKEDHEWVTIIDEH
ncbi:Branched-chain-amino-acid aminotransferase [Pseudocercospora fuligena]|uniref:Branched-chain-amino-acid aminotransferase n=1 Tax=Pseudocercospora fuligena TaxID=685502 RepID=A0A8H6RL60_9PEZI|nr:Branched-chain-amino-acid aminotransferase [Pseudocercospora fuligena]